MALNLNPVPPSPIPPWHRPVVAPIAQTLTEDGTISLGALTTYLDCTTQKAAVDDVIPPYNAVLPDGNYREQTKSIIIPGESIGDTVVWLVSGNFADAVALQFDSVHQAVNLKWCGDVWHCVGGNALKTDE